MVDGVNVLVGVGVAVLVGVFVGVKVFVGVGVRRRRNAETPADGERVVPGRGIVG